MFLRALGWREAALLPEKQIRQRTVPASCEICVSFNATPSIAFFYRMQPIPTHLGLVVL